MLKLTTRTPDWTDIYREERRRAKRRQIGDFCVNMICLALAMLCLWIFLVCCSVLDPVQYTTP